MASPAVAKLFSHSVSQSVGQIYFVLVIYLLTNSVFHSVSRSVCRLVLLFFSQLDDLLVTWSVRKFRACSFSCQVNLSVGELVTWSFFEWVSCSVSHAFSNLISQLLREFVGQLIILFVTWFGVNSVFYLNRYPNLINEKVLTKLLANNRLNYYI